jgi:hypothetical protein
MALRSDRAPARHRAGERSTGPEDRLVQVAQQDVRAMGFEQRLLRQVVAVARRCDDSLPVHVLDDLLAGTGPVRPALPAQRSTVHPRLARP